MKSYYQIVEKKSTVIEPPMSICEVCDSYFIQVSPTQKKCSQECYFISKEWNTHNSPLKEYK